MFVCREVGDLLLIRVPCLSTVGIVSRKAESIFRSFTPYPRFFAVQGFSACGAKPSLLIDRKTNFLRDKLFKRPAIK
jgi:hypothetical protein